MSKLAKRPFSEENIPDEQRDWMRSVIVEPYNKFTADAAALLSNGLTLADNVSAQVFVVKVQVPDDWVAPTLLNSWAQFDTKQAVGFRKDASGMVYLKGRVRFGTSITAPIFVLPAAYAPAEQYLFSVRGNLAYASLQVAADGTVSQVEGSTLDISLNVSFVAASRSPVPASCWPVSVNSTLPGRPSGVELWDVRDLASPRSRNLGGLAVDWDGTSNGQTDGTTKQAIRINNVPGLIPGKRYQLTFVAYSG